MRSRIRDLQHRWWTIKEKKIFLSVVCCSVSPNVLLSCLIVKGNNSNRDETMCQNSFRT